MSDEKSLAAKYKIPVPKNLDPKDTILVIEDQQDLRLIVVHHLQKLNFGVVKHCANGYEAIEMMKDKETGKIGAFICDMEMPVMGGLDFLAELRESSELDRGPFCMAMDQVSKEKLMLAVENGVDEILVKPFTFGDLMPKLRTAFAKFHNPANPEKVYELAKVSLREGNLEQAESIYKELAATAKKAARPVVGLARIETKRQHLDAALKYLDEAEQKNPNYVHCYVERAQIYALQNDYDKAVGQFKKAIDLSPLNAVRYKAAADILFKTKRYQEASELLELAIKHNLEFPDLYHYLSQAKFSLRDYKAASKYVRQALQSQPENVSYLNQLGVCLKETEQYDDAVKVYNQVIKLDPANLSALYNKGVLLKTKGDFEEAIKHFERALKKKPDFVEAQSKIAECQKEMAASKKAG